MNREINELVFRQSRTHDAVELDAILDDAIRLLRVAQHRIMDLEAAGKGRARVLSPPRARPRLVLIDGGDAA